VQLVKLPNRVLEMEVELGTDVSRRVRRRDGCQQLIARTSRPYSEAARRFLDYPVIRSRVCYRHNDSTTAQG
jgi:hypothetical protein